jgi:hypothetical protein
LHKPKRDKVLQITRKMLVHSIDLTQLLLTHKHLNHKLEILNTFNNKNILIVVLLKKDQFHHVTPTLGQTVLLKP